MTPHRGVGCKKPRVAIAFGIQPNHPLPRSLSHAALTSRPYGGLLTAPHVCVTHVLHRRQVAPVRLSSRTTAAKPAPRLGWRGERTRAAAATAHGTRRLDARGPAHRSGERVAHGASLVGTWPFTSAPVSFPPFLSQHCIAAAVGAGPCAPAQRPCSLPNGGGRRRRIAAALGAAQTLAQALKGVTDQPAPPPRCRAAPRSASTGGRERTRGGHERTPPVRGLRHRGRSRGRVPSTSRPPGSSGPCAWRSRRSGPCRACQPGSRWSTRWRSRERRPRRRAASRASR